MKHVESSIQIYFTKEYSSFRMINGNRQLNQSKINRIKEDIQNGIDVLKYCPILCVENKNKLDIIDGQHRFWVAKELKSCVWYILVNGFTLQDIAKINSNTEKWKNADYINCYIQQGNKHYELVQEFMDTYGAPLSVTLRLLGFGKVGKDKGVNENVSLDFKRGMFIVNHEEYARQFMDSVMEFKQFPGCSTRPFIIAIDMIIAAGKCDFDELVQKFKADPSKLLKRDSAKEYLNNLEEIYNKGKKVRKTIY